jgi:hypothetical protein
MFKPGLEERPKVKYLLRLAAAHAAPGIAGRVEMQERVTQMDSGWA